MNVIILGDKFQKRMKSKGSAGLLKIHRDYLIIKQYKAIKKKFPNSKIIYVCGFDSKKLLSVLEHNFSDIKKDIQFIYNGDYDNNNYGYSLQLVQNYLVDDLLILFGHTMIPNNLLNQIDPNKKTSQVFISNNSDNKLGCVINHISQKIENIFYDLDNKLEEIYFITKKDSISLREMLASKNIVTKNMFVFELLNKLIDNNAHIKPIMSEHTGSIKWKQKL